MRILMAVGVVAAAAASAATADEVRPPLDAFLSRGERLGLSDARALSKGTRAALEAGWVTSTEPRYGVPTFFWATRPEKPARSFRDLGLSPEQAARRYLWTHAELYRGEPRRWAEARLASVHDLGDGGAVIVAFQQDVGGVRLFRDEVKVVMSSKLELVALAGYLTPQVKPLGVFQLSAPSAVQSAFQDLTGRGLEAAALRALKSEAGYERFALPGEATPARARKVYFPVPQGLEPGFYVELEAAAGAAGERAYYAVVVSARDGGLLYRKNLTEADSYSYRVWADTSGLKAPLDGPQGTAVTPHPTGTPNSYDPGYVLPALVTLGYGPISTLDPWLPSNATETRGNNVFAYADISRSNGFGSGDLLPTTTGPSTFDRTYDTSQSPDVSNDQRMAATTQLFYNNNFFHDWYYDVGFDERAGNAQRSNFSRGGAENDPLNAEAQDYSGRNNANMSTPSDGASPRMQMYIFDATSAAKVTIVAATPQDLVAGEAQFGPQTFALTGELKLVDDGTAPLTDACTAITNAVSGKVALIDRGTCTFAQKVQAAQAAGAIGAIIADNQSSNTPPYLAGNTSSVTIPSLSVTRAAGTTLKTALQGGVVTVRLERVAAADRDGTIDNMIVAHEWGHYISNRLIGDGNGLSNNQGRGMGEGWGDFHSLLLAVRASDVQAPGNAQWQGVYALAGYTSFASDPNGYYFGIRRLPTSTDFTRNGLTFKHIADNVALPAGVPTAFGQSGRSNAEVHNTGEVWNVMLWEGYAALLKDSTRLTFDQAQRRMLRYLVGGYKATPMMPTFVEGRDAILAVAAAADVQDFALLWGAFARRGLGMQAVAPDRDSVSNSPVVESFVVGNAVAISAVTLDDAVTGCDSDGNLDNDEVGNLTVTVRNVGVGPLSQTTGTVTTTATGLTFPGGASITFPPLPPFGTARGTVRVAARAVRGIQGASFTVSVNDPSLAVAGPVTRDALFRVNYNLQPNGSTLDDVEAPMAQWTSASDPNGNTGSDWRLYQSTATAHWWFGPNPASPADTWLVSPSLDVGSTQDLVVTFKHRWDFEFDAQENYDGGVLEISTDDGRTWTDVGARTTPGYTGALSSQGSNPLRGRQAFVQQSANYPAFEAATVNLGRQYAGRTVKFRFRIGSDDAAAAKGWEVDDVNFAGITNKPFTMVVNDPNSCGTNRAPVVTIGADQVVEEGADVTLTGSATDPDGDAVTLTWRQVTGPLVALTGAAFVAPRVDADTELSFELTADDGVLFVGPLTQKVLVRNVNRPPVASAPAVVEVTEGQVATIVGTGTDLDGDPLTYHWTQLAGPTVELRGLGTDTVQLDAPAVEADTVLAFELVVKDAELSSAAAKVEVVVRDAKPLEVPGPDLGPPGKVGCGGCATGLGGGLGPLLGLLALLRPRRRR